jgi:hypothetical protein
MLRYLSPSREWSEAPADITAALKKLRTLPSHTLLVAGDGRVLGWAHAFGTPKKAPPLTVDAVTGAPTGRTGPILDERKPAPPPAPPAPCARPGCDQLARTDKRAKYCSDRCRRIVSWSGDSRRGRAA